MCSPCVPVDVVRDHEQETDDEEVGDDARPAVRDVRQGDPRQRDEAGNPRGDDERLNRERGGETDGEELREPVVSHQRDAEASPQAHTYIPSLSTNFRPAAPASPSSCATAAHTTPG